MGMGEISRENLVRVELQYPGKLGREEGRRHGSLYLKGVLPYPFRGKWYLTDIPGGIARH